jgi:hypothetical protein
MENAPIPPQHALFVSTNSEIQRLKESLTNGSNTSIYKDTCIAILHSVAQIRNKIEHNSSYALDKVAPIISHMQEAIHNEVPFSQLKDVVTKEMII